ncbi:Acetyl-/propionyl-coenzyme A carboxylase alpha chain [bioreactor metagenome]|uniref:Acetyl-/propionyl-coenzyme A carboxylase alpha chain n=1 Tax=bioreactor metagenome TaxID=1076179 RepID=A0A645A382_9ZZZZ
MGSKSEAKKLMGAANVPLTPGYHGDDQTPELLHKEADAIGYPVLIKAAAGGGGKGMRLVEKSADFPDALASCKREAISSFGDDHVLIEKYITKPRHIEIQVFADTLGNYVYLFERDCSVQRRHQKVLEEAPAPGMTEAMRQQMGDAAVAAARAVNYVGAGTVEFIVEQREGGEMNFFFMEMNTRLQVEHPVTEAITGEDLVEWQLRVASGETLPKQQSELKIIGHAIEARICAENPDNNFLPATGTLNVYRKPQSLSFERGDVRIDDGVREGDAISPFYDSMIAKLIVHGDTREQALARLDAALAQTQIVGLNTNVQFLRLVARSDSFAHANLDTALIQREEAVLFKQDKVGVELAVAAVVANVLTTEQAAAGTDPLSSRDGWRGLGVYRRAFDFQYGGKPVAASLAYLAAGQYVLDVQGADGLHATGPLYFSRRPDGVLLLEFGNQRSRARVDVLGEAATVFTPTGATRVDLIDPLAHAGDAGHEGGRLTAPMPGKVVSIAVKAGDKVTKGQALAVMEAMKMEHTIAAPDDGVVAEVLYGPGDQVTEGAELLKLTVAA